MKKTLFVLLILILLPGAIAISTDMQGSYRPGETMIIQIMGNILDSIAYDDVRFLRDGHIDVPFDYDIKRIEGNYYLYSVMPLLELEGNESSEYTLRIEDIETTVNGRQEELDFEQNFNVTGQIIEYTISPGIIISSDDFSIRVTSNVDVNQQIEVNFPFERSILLTPGENIVEFDTEEVSGGFYKINVGNYAVPAILTKEIEEPRKLIRFNPAEIDSRIIIGSEAKYEFTLINTGDEVIEEFSVSYNEEIISLDPSFPDSLEPGQDYTFNIILSGFEERFEEVILIEYGNESFEFPILIEYVEEGEKIIIPEGSNGSLEVNYYCSELQGAKCSASEVCAGDMVISRDVKECCLGTCVASEGSGSLAWVGYVLGAVLLIALAFVGYKYMKSKKQNDPFKEKIGRADRKIVPIF